MDGELRSARDAEPMVGRLTEAATLTEHPSIFVSSGRASKLDRSDRPMRFDGFSRAAYTGRSRVKGGIDAD
jgi:hypothetical protein